MHATISASQVNSLLRVLRMSHKVIGHTLDDLKGIHSSMYMHCILMEDYHKMSIEYQRKLNPKIQDVGERNSKIAYGWCYLTYL